MGVLIRLTPKTTFTVGRMSAALSAVCGSLIRRITLRSSALQNLYSIGYA